MECYTNRYNAFNLDFSSEFGDALSGADVESIHTNTHSVGILRRDIPDTIRPFLGSLVGFILFVSFF